MEERLKYKHAEIMKKCKKLSELARDIHASIDGLTQSGTFFGMTGDNIIDLHCEYELRNGKMPMSSESIKEAFRPDEQCEQNPAIAYLCSKCARTIHSCRCLAKEIKHER